MNNVESPNDAILQEDLEWLARKIKDMDELHNRSIYITGAAGLIGSLTVKAFLCANRLFGTRITCKASIRNTGKAECVYGNLVSNPYLELIRQDLMEAARIDVESDYIIHAASVTASKEFVTQPVETFRLACEGTYKILEMARRNSAASVVYISSMEVYGDTDRDKKYICEEDLGYLDILNVRSSYSEGKRAAECLCAAYAREYHMPVKIARLAQTFGPGISKDENRVFAQFARSAINGNDIVLHTSGNSFGNYCYTRDSVWGILSVLTKGVPGDAYTVTNENSCVRIKEMAQMVADSFGKGRVKVVYDIPEDNMQYGYAPETTMHLSAKKLNELGWNAQVGLHEAYDRMIKSMNQIKAWQKD